MRVMFEESENIVALLIGREILAIKEGAKCVRYKRNSFRISDCYSANVMPSNRMLKQAGPSPSR
jgi:hypothetical protein